MGDSDTFYCDDCGVFFEKPAPAHDDHETHRHLDAVGAQFPYF